MNCRNQSYPLLPRFIGYSYVNDKGNLSIMK